MSSAGQKRRSIIKAILFVHFYLPAAMEAGFSQTRSHLSTDGADNRCIYKVTYINVVRTCLLCLQFTNKKSIYTCKHQMHNILHIGYRKYPYQHE